MRRIFGFFICLLTMSANASLLNFTGEISDYDDVIITQFTVDSDQTVSLWTDSFDSGVNFDPITALWSSDGSFIAQNDDNASISPTTQTYYDSGFVEDLTAGTYYFTISVYDNFADDSLNILTGSSPFDTGCDGCTSGTGLYYSQWLSGVSSADVISSVPEPMSVALLVFGLAGIGFSKKKKTV
jgi:hypothetical protein